MINRLIVLTHLPGCSKDVILFIDNVTQFNFMCRYCLHATFAHSNLAHSGFLVQSMIDWAGTYRVNREILPNCLVQTWLCNASIKTQVYQWKQILPVILIKQTESKDTHYFISEGKISIFLSCVRS